jgi:hypothetical protein
MLKVLPLCYNFILLPSVQTQYTFVTLYNEGIVKSVCVRYMFRPPQMYSQMHVYSRNINVLVF